MNDDMEKITGEYIVKLEGKVYALTSACILLIGFNENKKNIIDVLNESILHETEKTKKTSASDCYLSGIKEILALLESAASHASNAELLRDLKPGKPGH